MTLVAAQLTRLAPGFDLYFGGPIVVLSYFPHSSVNLQKNVNILIPSRIATYSGLEGDDGADRQTALPPGSFTRIRIETGINLGSQGVFCVHDQ